MKKFKEVLRQIVFTLLLMFASLLVMELIYVLLEKPGVVSDLVGLTMFLLGFWIVYRTLMLIWKKSREDKKHLIKHASTYGSVLILLLVLQFVYVPKDYIKTVNGFDIENRYFEEVRSTSTEPTSPEITEVKGESIHPEVEEVKEAFVLPSTGVSSYHLAYVLLIALGFRLFQKDRN